MKRYITFKDYEEVLRIGKFWLDKCNDEEMEDGTVYHHLPLVEKDAKTLEKYIKQVEAADKKAIVINYELLDIRQILPPWIVYPHYPARDVHFTSYFTLFDDFIARMSKMELSVYKGNYPTPKYIEQIFTYKEID